MIEILIAEGAKNLFKISNRGSKIRIDLRKRYIYAKNYPSYVNREQFKKIRPILESNRNKTRPRKLMMCCVECCTF